MGASGPTIQVGKFVLVLVVNREYPTPEPADWTGWPMRYIPTCASVKGVVELVSSSVIVFVPDKRVIPTKVRSLTFMLLLGTWMTLKRPEHPPLAKKPQGAGPPNPIFQRLRSGPPAGGGCPHVDSGYGWMKCCGFEQACGGRDSSLRSE